MSKIQEGLEIKIKELAKANLPELLSKEIVEFLEEAKKTNAENVELKKEVEHYTKLAQERSDESKELKEKINKILYKEDEQLRAAKELEYTKLVLEDTARKLKMELLQKELELVKESKLEIKELVNNVFRNTTVRESIHRNINEAGHHQYNSNTNQNEWKKDGGNTMEDVITTKTVE